MSKSSKHLEQALSKAESYSEWYAIAQEHDQLSGAEEWKMDDISASYDYDLIRRRLLKIRDARRRNDVNKLVFHLHEGLHGNLGNIANPDLYQHSLTGTKKLVETYLQEVSSALDFVCDSDNPEFGLKEKLDFFKTTGRAFGQSALMLSGGAALGLFHLGVLKTLWEEQLLPNVISGSSAGSIMGGIVATHNNDELNYLLESEDLYLNAFKYVGWKGMFKGKPFLDGTHLEACLEENIKDMTFEEAYRYTGREINIPVSPYDHHQDSRLLNWRTSPNVLIRKASLASCSIPGVFPAVTLWAKDINGDTIPYNPSRKWVDGSIKDDLPIRRLSRLYGVNHSIVSQTNPHVTPFVSRNDSSSSAFSSFRELIIKNLEINADFALETMQRHIKSNDLNLIIDKVQSVLNQSYSGDINLIPPRKPTNIFRVMKNPSIDMVKEFITTGEKTTWPKVDLIRNTTMISRTFTECLKRLDQQETERLKMKSA